MMMESGLLFLSCILYAGTADVTAQYAAAMAMGLQNGAATRFSGAVVRYVRVHLLWGLSLPHAWLMYGELVRVGSSVIDVDGCVYESMPSQYDPHDGYRH
jgi:hypothetical protein